MERDFNSLTDKEVSCFLNLPLTEFQEELQGHVLKDCTEIVCGETRDNYLNEPYYHFKRCH